MARERLSTAALDAALRALPPWARVAAYLGVPAATALYFMLQGAGYIGAPAQTALVEVKSAHADVLAVGTRLDAHAALQVSLVEKLTVGLRVMCENSARDVAARNNCQNIR